jgi:murein DD-endopeptidase MepM/ murein hydrolase activator NlpD
MANNQITWPLVSNVIRGKSEKNTFGMVRKFANGSPKPHQGWDFSAAIGTAVYAISDGKVEFIKNHGDYGMQLCLSFNLDGKKYYAFYAHLQTTSVTVNATVEMDDLIGTTGNSGNASNLPHSEDHLHFEIRTQLHPGAGLAGRISPLKIYKRCPLKAPIPG